MARQGDIITETVKYESKNITPIKRAIVDIEDNKARMAAMREFDHKECRGVFRILDQSANPVEFPFRKYPGDKIEKYKLYHGQVYTIPRMVVDHLNFDCKTAVYGELGAVGSVVAKDAAGNMPQVVGYVNRFSFASLDFGEENPWQSQTILKASPTNTQVIQ